MTMFATVRGVNGTVLGEIPVDPGKGDIQQQVAAGIAVLQRQGTMPSLDNMPIPPRHNAPAAAMCELVFPMNLGGGNVQWRSQAMACPAGMPPGRYVYQPLKR